MKIEKEKAKVTFFKIYKVLSAIILFYKLWITDKSSLLALIVDNNENKENDVNNIEEEKKKEENALYELYEKIQPYVTYIMLFVGGAALIAFIYWILNNKIIKKENSNTYSDGLPKTISGEGLEWYNDLNESQKRLVVNYLVDNVSRRFPGKGYKLGKGKSYIKNANYWLKQLNEEKVNRKKK